MLEFCANEVLGNIRTVSKPLELKCRGTHSMQVQPFKQLSPHAAGIKKR